MKNRITRALAHLRTHLPGAVLLTLLCSAGAEAQCTPGLAIVVNKANATEGLSSAQLRRLLLGDLRNWPDKKKVSLVTPSQQGPAFKCVLASIVRMSDAEYHRFMAGMEFRGEEPFDMRQAASDAAAAQMINATPGGIGIAEAAGIPAISSSVKVLRINGKLPGEPGYPL